MTIQEIIGRINNNLIPDYEFYLSQAHVKNIDASLWNMRDRLIKLIVSIKNNNYQNTYKQMQKQIKQAETRQ